MLREIWGSVFLKNILLWNSLSLMYISVSKNEICIMDSAYSNLIDVCLIFDLFRNFILSFWLPIWLIWETNLLFHQPGFSHLITLSTKSYWKCRKILLICFSFSFMCYQDIQQFQCQSYQNQTKVMGHCYKMVQLPMHTLILTLMDSI